MRYVSLCSGIEAATVAWEPLGWEPVAFADIDPFACRVLKHYWPHIPNLGDLSKITEEQIAALGPIDLVIGGTPCQDLSMAGKRAGLAGERSGLFFDFVRIFDAARRLCGARFCLWENVPGALSSNNGADFASVVGSLAGCELPTPTDGWGTEGVAVGDAGLVEWAVLDAQWFGVAQRRRRAFALLDLGNWSNRPPVLLEPESVRGNSAPRRESGQRIAGTLGARAGGGGGFGTDFELDGGLVPTVADPITANEARTYTHEGYNFRLRNVVAHTLSATWDGSEDGTGRGTPLIATVATAAPLTHGSHPGSNAPGRRKEDDENLVVACFDETQITSPTNGSTADPHTAALAASARPPTIASAVAVRRLTPRECERLQGFPDDYTLIPGASDSRRYAALGNSMAVPVIRWIGSQIQRVTCS